MSLTFLLSFLPIATISATAFYVVCALLLIPRVRAAAMPYLTMPSPVTQQYLAPLDALRGLAALWVAMRHTVLFSEPVFDATNWFMSIVSVGSKAVPVFVMLSGFLIYRSVAKIETRDDLQDYAKRRILRIFPVYAATIVACVVIGQIPLEPRRIVSEFFMLRAINFTTWDTNPPSWSLFVEVLFYMILPIVVAVSGKRWVPVALLSSAVLAFCDPVGIRELQLWKYFLWGSLTSIAVTELRPWLEKQDRGRHEIISLALFGFGAVWFLADLKFDVFARLGLQPENGDGYSWGLGFSTALIMLGSICSPWLWRFFALWPLRVLGAISYSLYLWHPFFIWANFPHLDFADCCQGHAGADLPMMPFWYMPLVFVPGEILLAAVSFVLIERPFLMLRRRSTRVVQTGTAASAAGAE